MSDTLSWISPIRFDVLQFTIIADCLRRYVRWLLEKSQLASAKTLLLVLIHLDLSIRPKF